MGEQDTENTRFEQWLRRQIDRDDPLGELARHACDIGFEPDLLPRCRAHARNAHLETHLDRSLPVLGMREAWAEWSAHNWRALGQHWPAVLDRLNSLPREARPKMTWLPDEADHPFPNGRKIAVEMKGETVVLRFEGYEDMTTWKCGDNTAPVAAAIGEVTGQFGGIREEL